MTRIVFYGKMEVIDVFTIFTCVVGIISHLIGLYLLVSVSINDHSLLIDLSICDMCFAIQNIVWIIAEQNNSSKVG